LGARAPPRAARRTAALLAARQQRIQAGCARARHAARARASGTRASRAAAAAASAAAAPRAHAPTTAAGAGGAGGAYTRGAGSTSDSSRSSASSSFTSAHATPPGAEPSCAATVHAIGTTRHGSPPSCVHSPAGVRRSSNSTPYRSSTGASSGMCAALLKCSSPTRSGGAASPAPGASRHARKQAPAMSRAEAPPRGRFMAREARRRCAR
jgi:hypothetical protein